MFGKNKNQEPVYIDRVKCLGVRTGVKTDMYVDENFFVYSFLVEYTDGFREVVELQNGTKDFATLIKYIDMD